MKKAFFALLFVVCLTSLVRHAIWETSLEARIIKAIDQQCEEGGECDILISEITNFEWDTVSLFMEGGRDRDISDALGIDYYDLDLSCGIVFHKNDLIIKLCTTSRYTYFSTPAILTFSLHRSQNDPYYKSYAYGDAVLRGLKIATRKGGYKGYRYVLIA